MPSSVVRTFDSAGYYETRLVLTAAAFAFACYFLIRERNRNFLRMFLCGAFLQALMEYGLLLGQLRGEGYHLSVLGYRWSGISACLLQGLAEGGVLAMMSYWFLDLFTRSGERGERVRSLGYGAMCGLIVALALVVGWLARGQPITSARPMFTETSVLSLVLQTILLLAIVWFLGKDAFHLLGIYYAGSMIYVLATFEPLHLMGVRTVAQLSPVGEFLDPPPGKEFLLMAYSHLFEVAGAKIHYFILPYAFGWLGMRVRDGATRRPAGP